MDASKTQESKTYIYKEYDTHTHTRLVMMLEQKKKKKTNEPTWVQQDAPIAIVYWIGCIYTEIRNTTKKNTEKWNCRLIFFLHETFTYECLKQTGCKFVCDVMQVDIIKSLNETK